MKETLDLKDHDLVMPNMKEINFIDQFTANFLVAVDKDPAGAKKIIHEVIRPYMSAQLRTIALLEDQIGGYEDQNTLLLRSNAQMIHNCKEKGVALPNFDEIQRDFYIEKTMKEQLAKGSGIQL